MTGKTRAGIWSLAVVAVAACQRSTERTDGPAEAWPESAPNITPVTPAPTTESETSISLERDGQSFRVKTAERLQAPVVRLGGTAADPFELRVARASGFFLEVAQESARAVGARIDGKLLRYANALGPGTEMIQRPTTSGTEDYVRFAQAPAAPRLDYRVTLGPEVRGLHLVNGNLEFLDAEGAPRLRVNAPYGVDAKGDRFEASLTVVGCAVDMDPRLPWGRPVTATGASSCMVHVSWARDVRYPAVVDPAWVGTTNDMGLATNTHEVPTALLSTGRVLAAPASGSTQSFVFDPNTATWATVANAIPFGWQHRARMVGATNGRAWFTAGTAGSATARYDAATNQWTSTAPLPATIAATQGVGLAHHTAETVIVVGSNGLTFAYDLANDLYSARTSAGRAWGDNTGAVKLAADRIVLTGNLNLGFYGVYNMATDSWTLPSASVNNVEHSCTQLTPLSNGRMLAYGAPNCGNTNWARVFEPTTGAVITSPAIPASPSLRCLCSRTSHASYGTQHLIAGGRLQFDEVSGAITDLGTIAGYPAGADVPGALVKLLDGRALAVGSTQGNVQTAKTALYGPSIAADCPKYGAANTIFDPARKVCAPPCDGDFGGVTAAKCPRAEAPFCVAQLCLPCEKGHGGGGTRQCPAVRPVCLLTGACDKANGDQGTNATQPCSQSSAPFAKSDGSCGKCAATPECADTQGGSITRAGAICNSNTGACGNACGIDVDCPALQYCVDTGVDGGAGAKSCSPKKTDGESCTAPRECAKNVCLAGVCGVPVSDAGAADASGSTDASTDAPANAGDSAAGSPVADAGSTPAEPPSGPAIAAGPATSAPAADEGCQIGATRGAGRPWQAWLVGAIALGWCLRRRRRDRAA